MNNLTPGMGYRSGRMSEFDKLPKGMREALRTADHNWSGEQLLGAYRRKHPKVRTTALAVAFIRQQDDQQHAKDTSDPDFIGVMPRKANA